MRGLKALREEATYLELSLTFRISSALIGWLGDEVYWVLLEQDELTNGCCVGGSGQAGTMKTAGLQLRLDELKENLQKSKNIFQ